VLDQLALHLAVDLTSVRALGDLVVLMLHAQGEPGDRGVGDHHGDREAKHGDPVSALADAEATHAAHQSE
jgi:hypothetical protein